MNKLLPYAQEKIEEKKAAQAASAERVKRKKPKLVVNNEQDK